MKTLECGFFTEAMHAEPVAVPAGAPVGNVSTDSRTTAGGSLFFAIRGEQHDGHLFLEEAFAAGAVAAVVERSWYESAGKGWFASGRALLVVPDVRRALGLAAAAYRKLLDPLVIAVTGSAGKTTTRRILVELLDDDGSVLTGKKNYNNDIGVPLTIFDLEEKHRTLVLEMGMNHAGELLWLAQIARPRMVVITNIGDAHIGNLGSREAIAAAKREALAFLDADGFAFLNETDPFFSFLADGVAGTVVPFSPRVQGIETLEDHGPRGSLIRWGGHTMEYLLGGGFNIFNLAAALAVAGKLGLPESVLAGRIVKIRGVDARTQLVEGRSILIIDDCYNANPEAMRAAIGLLGAGGGRRVALLGDMFELGDASRAMHHSLGAWIAEEDRLDLLIGVGEAMREAVEAARAAGFAGERLAWFPDAGQAGDGYLRLKVPGDRVLVKGSRGMHMEVAVEILKKSEVAGVS